MVRRDGADEAEVMTTEAPADSIVIGYDGSHHADQALRWAAEQAELENRTLTLIHVVKPISGLELGGLATANLIPDDVRTAVREGGRTTLFEARARVLADRPDLDVVTILGEGDPRQMLLSHSERAACLVLGSRGRGRVTSLLLGSVSVALSRHASCPVVVVRPYRPGTVRRGVLVGTDGGETTRSTLEYAYRQASLRDLPLTVLHCAPDDSEEHRVLSESVAGLAEKFPDVPTRLEVSDVFVDRALIAASETMDLIVVGHHRDPVQGSLPRLGSHAAAVVEGARCPVAVVFEDHHA
ncbi:MAG: UspA domain protein [Marmoricola sp.]|nr:UspA domain protein [Marmoricola sp.]